MQTGEQSGRVKEGGVLEGNRGAEVSVEAGEAEVEINKERARESNPLKTVLKILRNPLLLALMAPESLGSAASSGMGDVLKYYLNRRIGWNSEDAAISDPVQCGCAFLALTLLLPRLQKQNLSAFSLVQLGNIASVLYIANFWLIHSRYQIFTLGSVLGGLQVLRMPSLRSIVADESDLTERTIYQAVVQAVNDVASGVAGLVFGYVFAHSPPWVMFLIAIVLQVGACIAAALMLKVGRKSCN